MSTDLAKVTKGVERLIISKNDLCMERFKIEDHIKTINWLREFIETKNNKDLILAIIGVNKDLLNKSDYILYSKLRKSLLYILYNNYEFLSYHLEIIFANAITEFTFKDLNALIYLYQILHSNNVELIENNDFLSTFSDELLCKTLYNKFFAKKQINPHIVEEAFNKNNTSIITSILDSVDSDDSDDSGEPVELVYNSIKAIANLGIDFKLMLQSDKEYIEHQQEIIEKLNKDLCSMHTQMNPALQEYFKPYTVNSHISYIEDIFKSMYNYLQEYSRLNRQKLEYLKLKNELLKKNYDERKKSEKRIMYHKLYEQIICTAVLDVKGTLHYYMSLVDFDNVISHINSELEDPIETFYKFDEIDDALKLQLQTIKSDMRRINIQINQLIQHNPRFKYELKKYVTDLTTQFQRQQIELQQKLEQQRREQQQSMNPPQKRTAPSCRSYTKPKERTLGDFFNI